MDFFRVIFFLLAANILFVFGSCQLQAGKDKNKSAEKQITVYCENGILGPIKEFAEYFETKHGINVNLQNGCARNLVNLIHYRTEADVFIPDSKEAIDSILNATSDYVEDSVFLGYQTLAFYVDSGNPEKFNGQAEDLKNTNFGIILANPETSTLGLATKNFLKKNNIYETVMGSVILLTTDSRGLVRNIANNQGTVAINWKSESHSLPEGTAVDVFQIDLPQQEHRALAVSLKDAPQKANAKTFLKELKSLKSQKIFKKYGIQKNQISKN